MLSMYVGRSVNQIVSELCRVPPSGREVTGSPSQEGTLLLGERNVLELIATGASLAVVLEALCRVIDEQSGLTSSVYLLDSDGRQLRFAAGPRVSDAWRQVTQSFPALPTNAACGSAVNRRHSVIVENIARARCFSQSGAPRRRRPASEALGRRHSSRRMVVSSARSRSSTAHRRPRREKTSDLSSGPRASRASSSNGTRPKPACVRASVDSPRSSIRVLRPWRSVVTLTATSCT